MWSKYANKVGPLSMNGNRIVLLVLAPRPWIVARTAMHTMKTTIHMEEGKRRNTSINWEEVVVSAAAATVLGWMEQQEEGMVLVVLPPVGMVWAIAWRAWKEIWPHHR